MLLMFPYYCNFIKCFRYNKSFCFKTEKVQLRQLHPLVIPVGFKPTTFRTGI